MQIHYWPDGTWCSEEDLECMLRYMSDDCTTCELPENIEETDICEFVQNKIKSDWGKE